MRIASGGEVGQSAVVLVEEGALGVLALDGRSGDEVLGVDDELSAAVRELCVR